MWFSKLSSLFVCAFDWIDKILSQTRNSEPLGFFKKLFRGFFNYISKKYYSLTVDQRDDFRLFLYITFTVSAVVYRSAIYTFYMHCVRVYDFYYSLFSKTLRSIYLEFGIGWGFLFYFFVMVVLTMSTTYFGVSGVYQASLFGIFVNWISQYYLIDDIIIDNRFFYFRSELSIKLYGSVYFDLAFNVDYIAFAFLFLTTSIGFCAVAYSLAYFKNEPHADRFILLLNWFIISMSLLVVADNAFVCFLGWELIGLTSFLLINFWTIRRGTLKSAFKAFIFNKLSDLFLLFFIILMVRLTGSASILVWNQYLAIYSIFYIPDLWQPALFLILASSIKSAQFLGHLWLPDSMEAPIPASALIHSATLVSAGVYLLLRMETLIQSTNLVYFVGFLGAFTAFYGAVVSAAQTDAKKLLAYSTISHCGFLFTAIYIGDTNLVITYLYLHGFFKAMTFFCVGNLMKISRGYQDTRRMGQFAQFLPVESVLLVFCASNLGGLPFTVGFFYKHLFQSLFYFSYYFLVIAPFLLLAMLCSIIYVFRLVFYSLFDVKKGAEVSYLQFTLPNLNRSGSSNTAIISVVFIVSLLIFSYLYYKYYIMYGVAINSSFPPVTGATDLNKLSTLYVMSILYYYLFSCLFAAVVYVLIYIECRYAFSNMKKKYYFIFSSMFLFFLFFVFSI